MESFFSIDLNGQSTANAGLKVSDSPMPQIGNLATQLELRLQLFPALSARHTSEIAALLEWHRTGRDTIDQLHAKDSDALEARHMAERAALLESYQVSRERHEQRFAQDSAAMQTKQLSEIQAFLQQNMALYQDMISALAQQRLQQQAVSYLLLAVPQAVRLESYLGIPIRSCRRQTRLQKRRLKWKLLASVGGTYYSSMSVERALWSPEAL